MQKIPEILSFEILDILARRTEPRFIIIAVILFCGNRDEEPGPALSTKIKSAMLNEARRGQAPGTYPAMIIGWHRRLFPNC